MRDAIPHPWRAFAQDWPHVRLCVTHLPGAFHAVTDGDTVWVHDALSQAERRAAICHEMVHLERREHTRQEPCIEVEHDGEVARRLIPVDALAGALAWTQDEDELADELWVPRYLVQRRMWDLSPAETTRISQVSRRSA